MTKVAPTRFACQKTKSGRGGVWYRQKITFWGRGLTPRPRLAAAKRKKKQAKSQTGFTEFRRVIKRGW